MNPAMAGWAPTEDGHADPVGHPASITRDEIEKTAALKGDTLRDFYLYYI